MYVEVPIIGSGLQADPYRPDLPVPYSAVIPTTATGRPRETSTIVWFRDAFDNSVPRRHTRIATPQARTLLAQLDPLVNAEYVEQTRTMSSRLAMPALVLPGLVAATRTPISRRALLVGGSLGLASLFLPRRAQAVAFTPLATDDFNRSNSSDLGSSWDPGYTGYNAAEISSNAAQSLSNQTAIESYNAITTPNDQYCECVIGSWISTSDGGQIGPALRMANPSTVTMYILVTSSYGAGKDEIYKIVTGTFTKLSEVANTWTAGAVMLGSIQGTNLTLYENGTSVLTASDSAISSGRGGMWLNRSTTGTGSITTWTVGEVTNDALKTLNLLGVGQ